MADEWPDCPVSGCQFKICLALNSDKCFHHTPGNKHVKRMKIDARNGVGSVITSLGNGGFLVEAGMIRWSATNNPAKW